MNSIKKIAYGGICSALCSAALLTASYTTAGQFTAAVLCGLLLLCFSYKAGKTAALYVFIVSSIIACFLGGNKQGIMVYILLTGYYPVLRIIIEKIRIVLLKIFIKLVIALLTGVLIYYIYYYIFDINFDFVDVGNPYVILILGIGYIVLFFIYDFSLLVFEKRYKPVIIDLLQKIIK